MEFTREETHSVLISSHIVSDIEKLSDYVAFLHQGRLAFCADKEALEEDYALAMLTFQQYENLDKAAVVGARRDKYQVRALLAPGSGPDGIPLDRAALEDIMLLMAKGGRIMRGLLFKDAYTLMRQYWIFLVLMVLCGLPSRSCPLMAVIYSGLIPISVLSGDDQCGWDPAGGSTAGVPKAGCPVQIRAGRGMYFGLGAGGVGGRRDSRRRDGIALGRGRAAQRGYFPVYRPCDAERQYALNVQIRRGKRAHVANRSASRSGRRTRRPRDCSAPKRSWTDQSLLLWLP